MQFYSGEKPSYKNVTTYNMDVLGRSLLSIWYEHFAHLAKIVLHQHVLPASIFRRCGVQQLPNPQCYYADTSTTIQCKNEPLHDLKPRILVNRDLFSMLSSTAGHKAGQEPLFHFVPDVLKMYELRMTCYRTGLTTPRHYNSEEEQDDSLLCLGGVARTPNCSSKPNVAVIYRGLGIKRSLKNTTLSALRQQLPKQQDCNYRVVSRIAYAIPSASGSDAAR